MARRLKSVKLKQSEQLRVNEEKWSKTLWQAGWTGFPSTILKYQRQLGLDPIDVNIILQLARHWWEADRLPFPTKETIAAAIDRSAKTVQRHLAALEEAGLIERIPGRKRGGGQGANRYRFDGLIRKATPYAEAELKERKAQLARLRRRGLRPDDLEVVEGKKKA